MPSLPPLSALALPRRGRPLRLAALALGAGLMLAGALARPAAAEPTRYPLHIRNCGLDLTFPKAPRRVVSIGQSETEILYSLGLGERIAGTALWVEPVLPQFAEENARVPRLADNDPSFESVVGKEPDLVTVQLEWHVGPRGRVGRREQFTGLGIPTYISPSDCTGKDNSGSGDGVRSQPYTMDLLYQEIQDLAAIFDVQDRGAALVARLRKREADAVAAVASVKAQGLPVVFWFSSRDVKGDAFVAGANGAPGYIMRLLGLSNIIHTTEEWPTVSWEAIATANPSVIVMGEMARRRFPADDVNLKRQFLETDPVTSQMPAVRARRFVVMGAQSMNPTLRTIDGIEVLARGIQALEVQAPGAQIPAAQGSGTKP